MATTEVRERADQPPALAANTLCEAFQMTSSAYPDRVALRTKDGGTEYSWADYARKVRALSEGFVSLGVQRGDTLGVMLTNRPEFHFADTAAMHVGATPFSVYNTYSPEQIEFLVGDAACPIIVTEQSFLDRILAVKQACGSLKHVIVVDGDAPDGVLTLDEVAGDGRRRLRLRVVLARREAGRRAHADLHLGHHRAAEGRAADARQPGAGGALVRQADPLPQRRARGLVPADGAHRRAQLQPLPAARARLHRDLLSQPARGRRLPAGGASHLVLRGAAHLGEAEGRARGGDGG